MNVDSRLFTPAPVFLCPDRRTCEQMESRLPGWICTTSGDWSGASPLLVRWNAPGTGHGRKTINPTPAILRARDPKLVERFWRLYRLPVPAEQPIMIDVPVNPPGSPGPRLPAGRHRWLYRVTLLDLRLIGIELLDRPRRAALGIPFRKLRPALYRLAQRGLYVLGLHGGAVNVQVERGPTRSQPRFTLVGVSAGPRLSDATADALAEALQETAASLPAVTSSPEDELVLGADPEFLIVQEGEPVRVVPASLFFPSRGGLGTDRVAGHPGRPLGELRPLPSPSPLKVFASLRAGLSQAERRLRKTGYIVKAGSSPAPGFATGGHIHFGGCKPDVDTLRVLDTYLAIPLFLLENPESARRRRQKGYGVWGDFRTQAHGGFEYRALSSWLVHPRFALAALCLAKTAFVERQALHPYIPACLARYPAHRRFVAGEMTFFRKLFPMLWQALEATPTYRRYERELDFLRDAVLKGKPWEESAGVFTAWNVGPASKG